VWAAIAKGRAASNKLSRAFESAERTALAEERTEHAHDDRRQSVFSSAQHDVSLAGELQQPLRVDGFECEHNPTAMSPEQQHCTLAAAGTASITKITVTARRRIPFMSPIYAHLKT
jgi:hypothetical protein